MMKKFVALIAALILLPSVLALQISVPTLVADQGNVATAILTITNNDGETLSNFQFTSDAPSTHGILFESALQTLAPGSSAQITVKGLVPSNFGTSKKLIGKIEINATKAPSSQNPAPTPIMDEGDIGDAVSAQMLWIEKECYTIGPGYDDFEIPQTADVSCYNLNGQFSTQPPSANSCNSENEGDIVVVLSPGAGNYVHKYYKCSLVESGGQVPITPPPGTPTPPGSNPPPSSSPGNSVVVTASADLYMQGKSPNYLLIDRVKIMCDGKSETIEDGDAVEMNPGEECEVIIRVENNHPDENMEDVEVEVDPQDSDIDGGSDTISRISDGDEEEVIIPLKVEEDADTGKVTVVISVEGEDESNKRHADEMEFIVEVERKKHDLKVQKVIVPSTVDACLQSEVDVIISVENAGERDEDEIAVELSIPGLKFVKKISDIEIDEEDEERVTFTVPVSKFSKGAYKGTVTTFYDSVAVSGSKEVTINVQGCVSDEEDGIGKSFNSIPLTELPPIVPNESSKDIEPAQTSSLAISSVLYTLVLLAANVAALTILGVMGYGLFKKKDDEMNQTKKEKVPQQFY